MISVIIPLFNESKLVTRLLNEVFINLENDDKVFEVVCVNDGSNDNTLELLKAFKEKKQNLKIINLSRNYGLQSALTAGLDYVKGELVIIMDGDFQDPPYLLPVLIEKINQSTADIVSAMREQRNEKLSRRIYFSVFHRIFKSISEGDQIANTGNFCIFNKKAHEAILRFTERNRYFPGIRNFIGFKHDFITYERPDRLEGEPKMSRRKLFALANDAIFSFSKWPVKACLYVGIAGIFIFMGAAIYTLFSKFTGIAPIGWSSTFLAISFFGSVQLTFLGLIGEYIYRIFKEVQNRPLYIIKDLYE